MNADTQESRVESEAPGGDHPLFVDAEATLLGMQAVVGRKWLPVIVYRLLADGPLGFSALKDGIDGVSSKMLAESLDDLEANGLVTREVLTDKPVRVEYGLTAAGRDLEPLVTEMVRWGTAYDVPGRDDGDVPTAREGDVGRDDSATGLAIRLEGN